MNDQPVGVSLHGEMGNGLTQVVTCPRIVLALGVLFDRDVEHDRRGGGHPGCVEPSERVNDDLPQRITTQSYEEPPRLNVVGGCAPARCLEGSGQIGECECVGRVKGAGAPTFRLYGRNRNGGVSGAVRHAIPCGVR